MGARASSVAGARVDARPRMLFLHGYMSPREPEYAMLRGILDALGVDLWYAIAPEGRADPFNPEGKASWFRYGTDNRRALPIAFDRPSAADVKETLERCVVSVLGDGAPKRRESLLKILDLASDGGRRAVLLCGESQGGIMASLLASRHLARKPGRSLRGVFLLRSAPDPLTWSSARWPNIVKSPPPVTKCTWGAFVGGKDDVFPEAFVRYALSPVPRAHFAVARDSTHYDADKSIYEAAMTNFVQWAR
jgi:pimeloyl-ACP methyl ester carboxylesterase